MNLRSFAFVALVLFGATSGRAQFTWNGLTSFDSSNSLSDSNNWIGGVTPTGSGTENIIFGDIVSPSGAANDTYHIIYSSSLAVNNITFNGDANRPTYEFTGSGTFAINGNISVGTGRGVKLGSSVALSLSSGTHTLTVAGDKVEVQGVISGSGAGLIKDGTGTLELKGANTYTGSTQISGGTLSVSSLASLGSSTSDAANLVLDGGTLAFTGPVSSTNRLFTIGTNGGGLDASGTGNLTFSNTGAIALSGTNTARTFKLTGTGTGTLNSILENNGTGKTSLVKDGTGTWSLNGANTYTGSTWIKGGTLKVGSTSLSNLTAVIVEAGAYLESHDVSIALGSIAGAGTIKMAGPSDRIVNLTTGADNTSTSFTGVIQELDNANSLGLVKSGTGTLTLSGANVYGGGTTVTGGMIVMGNNSALGTGSVTLNGGGLRIASGVTVTNTLIFSGTANVLAGNGTIGSAVTANAANVLSPGSSAGTLTFSAGLTVASGSAISFEIQNAAGSAGSGWDLISVTGGVLNLTASSNTITFNILSLNSDGNRGNVQNFNPGQSYSWMFASSPNANITGFNAAQFNLITGEFTNALSGGSFSISQALDQRSLLLNFTPVPEPSTWLLLGSGLGALALRFRRRRQQ